MYAYYNEGEKMILEIVLILGLLIMLFGLISIIWANNKIRKEGRHETSR